MRYERYHYPDEVTWSFRFWSSPHLWKKGPANALLFSTLEAVRQSGDDDSSDKAIAEEMLESERPQEQEDSETG